MNFRQFLHQRDALLRQAHLANVAFAYERIDAFGVRTARAQLHGLVWLRPSDPAGGEPWPTLVAVEGSQSALEEHFLEEELVELSDILGFLGEDLNADAFRFRLEELAGRYLPHLRRELAAAGIAPQGEAVPAEDPQRGQT
jgi:hypothetical protein